MRVLVVGAGGVGSAIAIAANASEGLDHVVVTDLDADRAARAVAGLDDGPLRGPRARRLRPGRDRRAWPAPSGSTWS